MYSAWFKNTERLGRGSQLAQSAERVTLVLRVMSLSPTLGVECRVYLNIYKKQNRIKYIYWGARLVHSVEHTVLDLRVLSLSPMVGKEIT